MRAKQDRISGGARNDRPHSSSGEYPSEIQCVQYGRVLEGQVRNTDTPGISGTAAELHRVSFLGEGLLCQHVGIEEQVIRDYIRYQEEEEKREEEQQLLLQLAPRGPSQDS